MRPLFIVVRILGAAAIIAAIVTQLVNNVAFWQHLGITNMVNLPINFFSYFTIDSNVGTVVVFLIGAVYLIRKMDDPRWFGILRGCITAYMVVTGIVYNMLLRGVNVADGLVVPWTNEVLHVVGPILMALDWLFAPGRISLNWKTIWWVVSFPIVWAIYTMIRGPLAYNDLAQKRTWYPYPFLDPSTPGSEGYVTVAFYVVLIAVIIGGVGCAVVAISQRGRWPLRPRVATA